MRQPRHTAAAIKAIRQAHSLESDFAGWLAAVLASVAAELGSTDALVARRPGSWEADLVLSLVHGTVGFGDEFLSDYLPGARP